MEIPVRRSCGRTGSESKAVPQGKFVESDDNGKHDDYVINIIVFTGTTVFFYNKYRQ